MFIYGFTIYCLRVSWKPILHFFFIPTWEPVKRWSGWWQRMEFWFPKHIIKHSRAFRTASEVRCSCRPSFKWGFKSGCLVAKPTQALLAIQSSSQWCASLQSFIERNTACNQIFLPSVLVGCIISHLRKLRFPGAGAGIAVIYPLTSQHDLRKLPGSQIPVQLQLLHLQLILIMIIMQLILIVVAIIGQDLKKKLSSFTSRFPNCPAETFWLIQNVSAWQLGNLLTKLDSFFQVHPPGVGKKNPVHVIF